LHTHFNLGIVSQSSNHGNGIGIVGICNVLGKKTINRHEGHFSRKLQSIHLLENLGSNLVILNDVMEQLVTCSHLNCSVKLLATVKVFNQCSKVLIGNFGILSAS